MDTNLFSKKFKTEDFRIKNYKHGYNNIEDLEFDTCRGQNLQISNIGESIYSDKYFPNFYTLMLPKHISKYGTVMTAEYLGNRKELKILNKGDLIFGAEGFEKGRSIVILDEKSKSITNIHGITLHQRQGNITLSIFVKCFLDYLRNIGLVDLFAVGGNGGSLAMKYWSIIPFPKFTESKQKEIAKLYHNPEAATDTSKLNSKSFLIQDNMFNKTAGITELDKSLKQINEHLNFVLDQIVNDETVSTGFDFIE